jgi:hypothetical protein
MPRTKEQKRIYDRARYASNRESAKAKIKAYRATPAGKRVRKREALKRLYGITLEQYEAMVQEQGGRCAICDQRRPLVVDHCHYTNRVRGLLCSGCNMTIGRLGDTAEALMKVIKYLGA